jgi:hypothetical protein
MRMLGTALLSRQEWLFNYYELLSECTKTFILWALASCEESVLRLRREQTKEGLPSRFMYIVPMINKTTYIRKDKEKV